MESLVHEIFFREEPFIWVEEGAGFYKKYWWIFAAAGILYAPVVFGLRKWMENRKAYDLRGLLAIWNFGLSIFSLLGAIYTAVPLLETSDPFHKFVCDISCHNHSSARWILWFCVAKVVEYGDTIFLVLRKKPVIFLHWYHHLVTMAYCWYMCRYSHEFHCAGWWFGFFNLSVHAIMYGYYGLAALGFKPRWSQLLTLTQILQMAFGIYVLYLTTTCDGWERDIRGFTFGALMYLSYFILFIQIFVQKYITTPSKPKVEKKE